MMWRGETPMKKILRNNGLSLVLFLCFAAFLVGQSLTGWRDHNNELDAEGEPPIRLTDYLGSGAFLEATMENWESEFLQMTAYVMLTVFLFQKGSAESKPPDGGPQPVDRDPRLYADKKDAPAPVRHGGWQLRIYENSLGLALLALFLLSFGLHAIGGCADYNEELARQGKAQLTVLQYMGSARFWFESLQNWQSEFLAIWAMVVLSIFLRQRGSPESKPVDAPHSETGAL
jgi:hypothetical protein